MRKLPKLIKSYKYLVDGDGMVIVHPDKSLIGDYNITDDNSSIGNISDTPQN